MAHISLKQLAIFIAVYEQGSTAKAGQVIALSQAAVSMALSELEKQLEVLLFDRIGKQLIPNQNALSLYPKAQNVLAKINEIENKFQQNKIVLQIAASTTIGNYVLPPLIQQFRKQQSQVEVVLHIKNTAEVCQGVNEFKYDVGFIEGYNPYLELDVIPWKEDQLEWFLAKDSQWNPKQKKTLSINDIQKVPLILREEGSGTRQIVHQYLSQYFKPTTLIELGNSEAIKQAVINDMGIGCLSGYVLQESLALGSIQFMKIKEQKKLQRYFYIISHPSKYMSEGLNHFLKSVKVAR